ncbi:uncharacterized protein B0I36DRAFT_367981 [Microdochium trichocladiopsis]|uniref:Uncharacterized protein n=1 Tax=Microdochium trichocladiopsis TaxID=1682393 RepID=A0A9P9BKV8_9PEZI|nr:uncharacterized protein B0I36DRAFT_367981 [Microdochium trichocladiopsis]KAH7021611.1 hypothetical protein B0I36DRAFT_367981 [Microdochium trichocladiopsis]
MTLWHICQQFASEYLDFEGADKTTTAASYGTPSLKLYFRLTKLDTLAGQDPDGPASSSVAAPDLSTGPATKASDAPTFTKLEKGTAATDLIDISQLEVTIEASPEGAGKLTDTTVPSSTPRSDVDQEAVAKIPDFVAAPAEFISDNEDNAHGVKEDNTHSAAATTGDAGAPQRSTTATSAAAIAPRSSDGIPNFRVNDDSRIEITAHEDELTVAMARSDSAHRRLKLPALSRYMTLNAAYQCKARLRVMSLTKSLIITNAGSNASFYLGHDPAGNVTPRQNGVYLSSTAVFWVRIDVTDVPIFNPATYRAPAILGYDKFDAKGAKYGSEYNEEFVKTQWDIVAPLTRRDPTAKDAPITNPSLMVVFRNAESEFVPAMSDSDEYQYWRIIKSPPINNVEQERRIKPGHDIRLYRDFRHWLARLYTRPLLATPVNIDNNGTRTARKYCLLDLRLRIDLVSNNELGDAIDYTLHKVTQNRADVEGRS